MLGNQFSISQLIGITATVGQNNLIVLCINVGVPDEAKKRRKPGARCDEIQMLARQQVVLHQSARGLAIDQQRVADFDRLQFGCQWSVRHLDAEKLELVLVIGAG